MPYDTYEAVYHSRASMPWPMSFMSIDFAITSWGLGKGLSLEPCPSERSGARLFSLPRQMVLPPPVRPRTRPYHNSRFRLLQDDIQELERPRNAFWHKGTSQRR